MHRGRAFFVALLAAAGLAVAALPASQVDAEAVDPPNIVMIYTDDQTVADMQFMPKTQAYFDDEGTTYTNAYVALSLCCPARAAIVTGQHAQNNGVWSNKGVTGGYSNHDADNALPVWLANAGYYTAHIGKSMHGVGRTVPPGWDDYRDPHPSDSKQFNWSLADNGVLRSFTGTSNEDYATYVMADMAADVITEKAPGGPFFLKFTMSAPHVSGGGNPPIVAPEHRGDYGHLTLPRPPSFNVPAVLTNAEIADLSKLYRRRAESLKSADVAVEKVMTALEASGELDNTVVVFTSDNGFLLGEHGDSGKVSFFDESLRVPLLIRGPGFGEGVSDSRPTQNIDLPVTFAEIAGAEPLVTVDGLSILSELDPDRVLYHTDTRKTFSANWWSAVNTSRFVYVAYSNSNLEHLYDLEADPYQLNNLSSSNEHAALKQEMQSLLAQMIGCSGAECFVTADNDQLASLIGSSPTTTTTAPTTTTTLVQTTTTTTPGSTTTTTVGADPVLQTVAAVGNNKPGFTVYASGTVEIVPPTGATRFQVRYKQPGKNWKWTTAGPATTTSVSFTPGTWTVAARAYRSGQWQAWNASPLIVVTS